LKKNKGDSNLEIRTLDIIYQEYKKKRDNSSISPGAAVWIGQGPIRSALRIKSKDYNDEKKYFEMISELILLKYIGLNVEIPLDQLELLGYIPEDFLFRLTTAGRKFLEDLKQTDGK
jgi:hypothetical protein